MIGEKFSATLEQIVLIYAGKILKDNEIIEPVIKNGQTVHLVIKTDRKPDQSTSAATATSTTTSSTSAPSSQTTAGNQQPPMPFGMESK